jgi:hypothetical protein
MIAVTASFWTRFPKSIGALLLTGAAVLLGEAQPAHAQGMCGGGAAAGAATGTAAVGATAQGGFTALQGQFAQQQAFQMMVAAEQQRRAAMVAAFQRAQALQAARDNANRTEALLDFDRRVSAAASRPLTVRDLWTERLRDVLDERRETRLALAEERHDALLARHAERDRRMGR